MKKRVALFVAVMATASATGAQQAGGVKAVSSPISAARLALARELTSISRMGSEGVAFQNMRSYGSADTLSRMVGERMKVTAAWMNKYLPADTLAAMTSRAYAREFSESELRQLIAFYKSPIGKRLVAAKADLLRQSTSEVAQVYALHGAELSALMSEAVRGRRR